MLKDQRRDHASCGERLPLTLPMLAVGAGYIAFLFTPGIAASQAHPRITTLLRKVVLIVAVMGAGSSIDRRFTWRGWISSCRLLVLVMPISIATRAALAGACWDCHSTSPCCSAQSSRPPTPCSRTWSTPAGHIGRDRTGRIQRIIVDGVLMQEERACVRPVWSPPGPARQGSPAGGLPRRLRTRQAAIASTPARAHGGFRRAGARLPRIPGPARACTCAIPAS